MPRLRLRRGALNSSIVLGAVALIIGSSASLATFTFGYAKGWSYLTNDPQACANCHVMGDHLKSWSAGSHRQAATCNDCHMPRSFIPKYLAKASNGFFHSLHFTTGHFPDPLRIKPSNTAITERACRTCHAELAAEIDPSADQLAAGKVAQHKAAVSHGEPDGSCIRCHSSVGHAIRQ
jgi:cytochrome c nitrite reductase small subunit